MGAPKGNRNAVGHGRPPKHYTDEQLEELGQKLVDWTKSEEFKKAVHICEFYLNHTDINPIMWKMICTRDCFRAYYNIAQKRMAIQILKNKDMHHSFVHRYLCFYDRDLHEFEEETKDREAARKKEEQDRFQNLTEHMEKLTQFFSKNLSENQKTPLGIETSSDKEDLESRSA